MPGTARIPVVSVIGRSDSGKTGVMESLIRSLTERGHRVASVKHHHAGDIDVPGKDSWRHARAGAVMTIISAPTEYAVFQRVDRERTLEELADIAQGADILVSEGFKRAGDVRIEVIRKARSDELTSDPTTLWAVVTDDPGLVPAGIPTYGFGALDELTGVIEKDFLTGGGS